MIPHIEFQFSIFQTILKYFCSYVASYFGINLFNSTGSYGKLNGFRTIVFVSLLSGSVIWISYRGILTSALAVPKDNLPFDSLESLLETNFILNTMPKSSGIASFFLR